MSKKREKLTNAENPKNLMEHHFKLFIYLCTN